MIGSLSGCEQFAVTAKQYFETYKGEIPDWIFREYMNNYMLMKKDVRDTFGTIQEII